MSGFSALLLPQQKSVCDRFGFRPARESELSVLHTTDTNPCSRAETVNIISSRSASSSYSAVSSAGIYHFPCRDDLVKLIDACISEALEKLLRPPAPEDADAAPYPVGASPPPTVPSAPSSLSAAASGCATPAVCPPLPPPSLPPAFHEPPPEPMVRSASQDCPSAKSVGVPSPPSPSQHKKACQVPKDLLAQIVKSSIASDGPP
ncbi:uncharacterized protein LOC135392214 [Ornithodoros turicata]|uniref:uncharacterized protein LOC135392214 n=1 Tax=Ornithodoros turicata TaxID=34597 RepID=UPI003138C05B